MKKARHTQSKIVAKLNLQAKAAPDVQRLEAELADLKERVLNLYLRNEQLERQNHQLQRVLDEFNERYHKLQWSVALQRRPREDKVFNTSSTRWPIQEAAKDLLLDEDKLRSLIQGQLTFKHQPHSKEC
jgi:hypothetical protein